MALADNLIAYWKLDETSGDATDSSGNSYTATNNGTASFTSAKINNGADFGASNTSKYFTTADSMGLNSANAGVVSIAGWLNVTTAPSSGTSQGIFGFTDLGNPQLEFVYNNSAGTYQLSFVKWNGTAAQVISINQTLTTSTWFHVGFVKNGTSITAYVNGSSIGGGTISTGDGNGSGGSDRFVFGRHPNAAANYYSGLTDELGVWDRALTSDDMTDLYNSGSGLSYPFGGGSPASTRGVLAVW